MTSTRASTSWDRPVRTLVADDDDGVRDLVALLLELEPDFDVVARARNGAEALSLAEETEPDLVVLDVSMPVLDGLAAASGIRRFLPAAHLVMFTALTDAELEDQARAAGANAVLEKGAVGVQTLVQRLRAEVVRPTVNVAG
jgi:DNA-binding NarL/FixJ family response regulator